MKTASPKPAAARTTPDLYYLEAKTKINNNDNNNNNFFFNKKKKKKKKKKN
jgi:hypothetical protein